MRYNENVDYPFGPFRIALMVWNTQGKSAGIDSVALDADVTPHSVCRFILSDSEGPRSCYDEYMTRRGASDPNLFARDVLKRIIAKHDPEGASDISQSNKPRLEQDSRTPRASRKSVSRKHKGNGNKPRKVQR